MTLAQQVVMGYLVIYYVICILTVYPDQYLTTGQKDTAAPKAACTDGDCIKKCILYLSWVTNQYSGLIPTRLYQHAA